MTAPFTTAVIGCGPAGDSHVRATQMHPSGRSVGVYDVDRVKSATLAATHGVDQLGSLAAVVAEDPHVVCVATGPVLQSSVIEELLTLGYRGRVLAEKPLTLDGARARELVEACELAGVVLCVNLQRSFSDPMRHAMSIVQSGALGHVWGMNCRGLGGTVLDWTPHWIDLSLRLFPECHATSVEFLGSDGLGNTAHADLALDSDVALRWRLCHGIDVLFLSVGRSDQPLVTVRGSEYDLLIGAMTRYGDDYVPGAPLVIAKRDGTVLSEWPELERALNPQQWVRSLDLVAAAAPGTVPDHAASRTERGLGLLISAYELAGAGAPAMREFTLAECAQ